MLGLPGISEPVQKDVLPGSWLMALVLKEWMKQRSSATVERWGSSSLIHTPLVPCWANLNMLGATSCSFPRVMVVTRCPLLTDFGNSVLKSFSRPGLRSKRSTWLGAPAMKRKMMRLARALWCIPAAAPPTPGTSEARAAVPSPIPELSRNRRRD